MTRLANVPPRDAALDLTDSASGDAVFFANHSVWSGVALDQSNLTLGKSGVPITFAARRMALHPSRVLWALRLPPPNDLVGNVVSRVSPPQVVRAHAGGVVTRMKSKGLARRGRAFCPFQRQSVRLPRGFAPINRSQKAPVAKRTLVRRPRPAAVALLDFAPEPFLFGLSVSAIVSGHEVILPRATLSSKNKPPKKPSYTPDWGKARRIDVSQIVKAMLA